MDFKIFTIVFSICFLLSKATSNNVQVQQEWEETNWIPRPHLQYVSQEPDQSDPDYLKHLLNQIKYWYYPGHWDDDYSELIEFNSTKSLITSSLQKDKPYKILIHGYLESGRSQFTTELVRAYREKMDATRGKFDPVFKDVNIISVGWAVMSGNQRDRNYQEYDRVVKLLEPIGERVAKFLLFVRDNGYIKSLDDVHCIGHSLGAHICGLTGKFVKQKSGGHSLARVTGLDPAGPLITRDIHLNKDDAKFVDVIHTDYNTSYVEITHGADSFPLGEAFGSDKVCGHIDFFVNGGSNLYLTTISFKHPCYWEGVIPGYSHVCLHNYAYKAYSMSITKPYESMEGYKCKNYPYYISPLGYWCTESAVFGEYINANPRVTESGEYYLRIDKEGNCY